MTPDPDDADADPNVQLRQAIGLTLLDGTSLNPFNASDTLGVADPTFKGATAAELATMRGNIRRQFSRLERNRRARLSGVTFTRDGTKLTAEIVYVNLETGGRQNMELSING